MRYTVFLYALDGDDFARQLRDDSEAVLARTQARLKGEKQVKSKALKLGMSLAGEICRGTLPPTCSDDHFWALQWLAETELEAVPISTLVDINRYHFIESVGFMPLIEPYTPPFPLPHSEANPPWAGYLPRDQAAIRVLPALAQIPKDDRHDVDTAEALRYSRQQLAELLESIAEDGLDALILSLNTS